MSNTYQSSNMSHMSHMLTYIWCSEFGTNPFEIKVFAHNVEEARKEVLAVMDEIARWKSEYTDLDYMICACLVKEALELKSCAADSDHNPLDLASSMFDSSWPPHRNGRNDLPPTPKNVTEIRAKQAELVAKIPANFFNGCFASGPFDYTADAELRFADETLGDFIKNTEPRCLGPVRMVSFSSSLDG